MIWTIITHARARARLSHWQRGSTMWHENKTRSDAILWHAEILQWSWGHDSAFTGWSEHLTRLFQVSLFLRAPIQDDAVWSIHVIYLCELKVLLMLLLLEMTMSSPGFRCLIQRTGEWWTPGNISNTSNRFLPCTPSHDSHILHQTLNIKQHVRLI